MTDELNKDKGGAKRIAKYQKRKYVWHDFILNIKEDQMKDLFVETLSQEMKDKLQIQVVNPERDQAFRYNKYLAKVNQFLSLTKFYAGARPRI